MTAPLQLTGAPGSPYTRKMLAVLRYRRLPYQLLIGEQASALGLPEPRVALLPTFYLPDDDGTLQAVVDSTPLIRRFEREYPQRSVVPADPALAFLDYLLEDYADEWLTKAMFHYRWHYPDDIDKAGTILPMWRGISASAERLDRLKAQFSERQISRLYVVGSNDTTAPVIEDSYRRFLAVFDGLLQNRPFLFGSRPAASDFAVYGQLTQLAGFDPTPMALCLAEAPRVKAWTDLVDDLSGAPAPEDGWISRDRAAETLGDLLREVGRVYVPAMLANAESLAQGGNAMTTTIDGRPWTQPTFSYQRRALGWVRDEFAALSSADRAWVAGLLDGTGCEPLFEVPA